MVTTAVRGGQEDTTNLTATQTSPSAATERLECRVMSDATARFDEYALAIGKKNMISRPLSRHQHTCEVQPSSRDLAGFVQPSLDFAVLLNPQSRLHNGDACNTCNSRICCISAFVRHGFRVLNWNRWNWDLRNGEHLTRFRVLRGVRLNTSIFIYGIFFTSREMGDTKSIMCVLQANTTCTCRAMKLQLSPAASFQKASSLAPRCGDVGAWQRRVCSIIGVKFPLFIVIARSEACSEQRLTFTAVDWASHCAPV